MNAQIGSKRAAFDGHIKEKKKVLLYPQGKFQSLPPNKGHPLSMVLILIFFPLGTAGNYRVLSLTLNGFSPVWVNMCRLMSNSLAKSLPHWGHGIGPELPCERRCSRYGSSFITSIPVIFAVWKRKFSLISYFKNSCARILGKHLDCENYHMTDKHRGASSIISPYL